VRIALLEYFSALPPGAAPPSLRRAGGALLRAVSADLADLPGVTPAIVTAFDGGRSGWRETLRRCDAALVLAPEEQGALERLARRAGRGGRLLIGPGPRAVRITADKRETARRLEARGIPVPAGTIVPRHGAEARLRRFGTPFVIKPRDGCGCRGVSVVRAASDIAGALRRADRAGRRRDLLIEEYVPGEPASVSVLVWRDRAGSARPRALCLALNRQVLRGRGALRYAGGETPWDHPAKDEALRLAAGAVQAIAEEAPDLLGYVGVDLVLAPEGPRIIEINPRLTTSYLGLRRVLSVNPSGLMLGAALGRPLPRSVPLAASCSYRPDGAVSVAGAPPSAGRPWRSTLAGTSAAST
jgi:hypothetical protein